jgi:hypothetical protein
MEINTARENIITLKMYFMKEIGSEIKNKGKGSLAQLKETMKVNGKMIRSMVVVY